MESIDDLVAGISREAKELLSCLVTWEMYETWMKDTRSNN